MHIKDPYHLDVEKNIPISPTNSYRRSRKVQNKCRLHVGIFIISGRHEIGTSEKFIGSQVCQNAKFFCHSFPLGGIMDNANDRVLKFREIWRISFRKKREGIWLTYNGLSLSQGRRNLFITKLCIYYQIQESYDYQQLVDYPHAHGWCPAARYLNNTLCRCPNRPLRNVCLTSFTPNMLLARDIIVLVFFLASCGTPRTHSIRRNQSRFLRGLAQSTAC